MKGYWLGLLQAFENMVVVLMVFKHSLPNHLGTQFACVLPGGIKSD